MFLVASIRQNFTGRKITMSPASEPPRDLLDRMIRQGLSHAANLRAFLHQAVPTLADGFDCDRARLLQRQFPLDDWRHREADLPFEVPYRLGDKELWALVYVLIEHQSAEDPAMPLRLLYCVVLYWERHGAPGNNMPRPSRSCV
jgi:hypothetical protein